VWLLQDRLDARADREIVRKKFEDYGTSDTDAKANKRLAELSEKSTADAFLAEMRRFLPAKRVKQISDSGLDKSILAVSDALLRQSVLRAGAHTLK